tara:strand:- start:100 stop:1422 length:1323 start_codon:yes stop_codon:yes gene_type:complete
MELLYLLIGLVSGASIGLLFEKNKAKKNPSELNLEQYISRDLYLVQKSQLEKTENEIQSKEYQIGELKAEVSSAKTLIQTLNDRIEEEGVRLLEQQQKLQLQFENMANEIIEKKSEKFTEQNKKNINLILKPLGEKIKSFEQSVNDKHEKDQTSRAILSTEIKMLQVANQKISQDAINLTNALKGDSKIQGDWGELQLEVLLENAGLFKGIHFRTQNSMKDDIGNDKRPDCIIDLPDHKNLIIDSKVSLTAYEKFANTENEIERLTFLKQHVESIKKHIKDLAGKDYPNLYSINTPDYVLMFIPIEPAITIALQEDSEIFNLALNKNIILVSTSTLLATMRTVSFIWQQENQKKNVLEIARQSGALYDKFCGFINDLESVGKAIEMAQKKYDAAENKLSSGRGNLIFSVEKIKTLGAKTNKSISKELLDKSLIEGLPDGE